MHKREKERALLKRKLEAGVNIHMPAPRRIGKTWLLKRLAEDLPKNQWHVIDFDVQGMSSPKEFAKKLCQRIQNHSSIAQKFWANVKQRLNTLSNGASVTDPKEALGQLDPIEFCETLVASLDAQEGRTAILIDEIAYFFLKLAEQNPEEAYSFAYKLRSLQLGYTSVQWVMTGSIGLDVIARRFDLEGAFVDFEIFVLEPFTPDEARSFLRDPIFYNQMTAPFDADDDDFNWLFEQLGWLAPYYLKSVANAVRPSTLGQDNKPKATRGDLEKAYDALLQSNRTSEFAVYPEHIDKNLRPEDRFIARHCLDTPSAHPGGEREETIIASITGRHSDKTRRNVKDVLNILANDGLLIRQGDRWKFLSGLIRGYWQRHEA
ncbi:MAG: AAA family ATPase [Rhodospirillaceae bacterium]